MRFKTKLGKILVVMICIVMGLFAFCKWQNNGIVMHEITYKNEDIPKAFEGYRILQISDLHNKVFGSGQEKLLAKIKKAQPDIIVVTGDLIDAYHTDMDVAMTLIDGATAIAPVYYVSGNHEAWSGLYDKVKAQLEKHGAVVLDNEKALIAQKEEAIELIGLADPSVTNADWFEYGVSDMAQVLDELTKESNNFKILLSHRPELFDIYASSSVDLVFSGHAHGGQVRLPFIGGLIAPDQGLFPKLTEGMHTSGHTSMVISRGLGNSIIPLRLFNRPELIVVTLSVS